MRQTRRFIDFFNRITAIAVVSTAGIVALQIAYWAWCYIHMVD